MEYYVITEFEQSYMYGIAAITYTNWLMNPKTYKLHVEEQRLRALRICVPPMRC